jgi:hypothetical protein
MFIFSSTGLPRIVSGDLRATGVTILVGGFPLMNARLELTWVVLNEVVRSARLTGSKVGYLDAHILLQIGILVEGLAQSEISWSPFVFLAVFSPKRNGSLILCALCELCLRHIIQRARAEQEIARLKVTVNHIMLV